MTLKQFRELTKNLHEETPIMYHAHDKGCVLSPYDIEEVWMFKKVGGDVRAVVINPGPDYDGRRPSGEEKYEKT